MKSITLKAFIILAVILSSSYIAKAQWLGSSDENGVSYRLGSVGIGITDPGSFKLNVQANDQRSLFGDGTNSIALGQWDGLTNRIESMGRKLFLTSYNGGIGFGINGSQNMILDVNGNIGIGTTTPSAKLHIYKANGGNADPNAGICLEHNTSTWFQFSTPNSKTAGLLWGDTEATAIGRLNYDHTTNTMSLWTNTSTRYEIDGNGDHDFKSGKANFGAAVYIGGELEARGGLDMFSQNIVDVDNITFHPNAGGAGNINCNRNDGIKINNNSITTVTFNSDNSSIFNGNVGIGTTTTGPHKLAVDGSIGAREVIVETTTWSDFVFADNYQLKPLSEVESFIKENKHLPDIPSEKEVKENGVNIGEMNAKLLQKIEELTLYVIKQNKKIETQQKQINQLLKNQNK